MSNQSPIVKWQDVLDYLNEMVIDAEKDLASEPDADIFKGYVMMSRKIKQGFENRETFEHILDTKRWIEKGMPDERK